MNELLMKVIQATTLLSQTLREKKCVMGDGVFFKIDKIGRDGIRGG